MAKPNGYILYEGPSMLDGAPIVVIATGFAKSSKNGKTGALIQSWIIRSDITPVDAANSGDDASVCGDCPHRGTVVDGKNVDRSCYVTLFQAPRAVYDAYHRGNYSKVTAAQLSKLTDGIKVRIGSYGDPAAVPLSIWKAYTKRTNGWTGYTHQYRAFPELAPYCMASADSLADRAAAKLLGFRVFRVTTDLADMKKGEIVCPASKEAGHKSACDRCGLCKGATSKAKKDIVIRVHGVVGTVNAMLRRAA